MIVSASIPITGDDPHRPSRYSQLQALTAAYFRQQRDQRHLRVQAFLAAPQTLDHVLPGLATLPPGTGNDRLRALRYSDDTRYGLSKLGTDPEWLRAALVAQRIRCWQALRPTEAFAVRTCRQGQGKASCRFLARDEGGPICAKNTPVAASIQAAVQAGQMIAQGDHCSGRSAR